MYFFIERGMWNGLHSSLALIAEKFHLFYAIGAFGSHSGEPVMRIGIYPCGAPFPIAA